ncbi:hypothetical protein NL676_037983 [Syzygium grande]|nr:hypothetical protein NL676_037983 [Syzygium grande]
MGRKEKMEEWGDGSDGSVGSSFLVDVVVVVVGVERRGPGGGGGFAGYVTCVFCRWSEGVRQACASLASLSPLVGFGSVPHFLLCFSHPNDTGEIGEVAEFSGRSIEQPTLFSPVAAPWERHRFIRCSDVPFGGVCNLYTSVDLVKSVSDIDNGWIVPLVKTLDSSLWI